MALTPNELKKMAAEEAVKRVQSGMVVGLGTGSTAAYAVSAIGDRMKTEGLKIIGVPTSARTFEQAQSLGIPLATLEAQPKLDLAIDGADEIELSSLNLIKGAGGALLREKLVEVSADRLIIVADKSKKVNKLGEKFALPVEIVRFGWKSTFSRVEALGCQPVLRLSDGGEPFITDEQHYIIDCQFGPMDDPVAIANALKATAGVVEHGLFIDMTAEAIVATDSGIEVLSK
ncbi:ribose 5-phosphate isomerase A [Synechococcus sp. PCC 7336]|uniref:ribose 5-phosphate isomerase A n=1 Tax=Synechococcus sp. PCC 7336 TaxID=195250 RepID=UPI000345D741|nr:ribose 5-phosphate isomerase A [Synechococcus sp. PCC 7336]